MKRIARMLARIYPAAWRERYGEELDGLIEDRGLRASDLLDVLRAGLKMRLTSRALVWVVLPCAMAGALVGVVVAMRAPILYSSQAVVIMSASGASDNGAGAATQPAVLGSPQYPELGALFLETLADREALKAIILRDDLYPRERTQMPLNEVVNKMQKATFMGPLTEARHSKGRQVQSVRLAFVLRFSYPDPQVAQKADADLISLLSQKRLALASGDRFYDGLSVMYSPSLPQRPDGLSRATKSAIGLIAGLLCGLMLAMMGIGGGVRLAGR